MNIYFYPCLRKVIANPYTVNFRKELEDFGTIVNDQPTDTPPVLDLFKHIFDSKVYIFNWIESIADRKFGVIQTLLFLYVIWPVLRLRDCKIVWIFHNFVPHEGDSFFTKQIRTRMLRHASLIVTHSGEALDYLRKHTQTKIIFLHHPIKEFEDLGDKTNYENCDILIWGSILKYKNILEFVEYVTSSDQYKEYKLCIIGKCNDEWYDKKLKEFSGNNIQYENRKISFSELQARILKSRYVVFPYLSNSVSSSGALIDTIALGGTPIGPDKGEFHDLEKEGICFTFNTYDDILLYLKEEKNINELNRLKFIKENSWYNFVKKVITNV